MANQPPVIPEITKAYENDPRTILALQAMKAGGSTAPVATRGYGVADGIARVLQGIAGAHINKQQEQQYDADQAKLLALRQARGVDGLTGTGAPGMPTPSPVQGAPDPGDDPTAGAPSPQLAAIASALGSPPPQSGPPPGAGPPSIPMAPIPAPMAAPAPQAAPGPSPAAGGGPMGQTPFGPTAAPVPAASPVPPIAGAPLAAEPIPSGPAPVAKPVAPAPVGAVRSPMLDAAYKIMSDANPYESAGGQDMYTSGLEAQGKLNEAAAERAQRLQDMGYQSDLSSAAEAQQQDRAAAYADRTAALGRNFERGQTAQSEAFTGGQNDLTRANERTVENMRASSALAVAKVKEQGVVGNSTTLNDDERAALSKAVGDGRIDLKGITKFQAKVVAQSLIDNPNLDAIHLHAAATLAANPAAQQKAALVQAVPTVLANVRDAGKKLNFSDAQFLGKMQAYAKGQFNDPDMVSYMSQRNDAMQTLAQVMSGVGATDMRTKMESDAAPQSMSPKAWDGWYSGQIAALRPRIQMYEKKGLLEPGSTAAMDAATSGTATPSAGGWGKATVVGP